VAAEAARSYELTRNPRGFWSAVVGASFLAGGIIGSPGGDGGIAGPAAFIGVGVLMAANAAQIILRWPTRITARDDGVVFKALTYERLVPWADLESVRVHHGRYGGSIRWRLTRRPHITTAATFENLHHLLVDVEHRAPQAMVSL
jgi:hypothetical protein